MGAASGALSTTQQLGFALGVALTGVIFFGAGQPVGHAFEISLVELALAAGGIVAMSQALPSRREPAPRPVAAPERGRA